MTKLTVAAQVCEQSTLKFNHPQLGVAGYFLELNYGEEVRSGEQPIKGVLRSDFKFSTILDQ